MITHKLTKGNPAITDLGDPNRPMKIADKYGGLYDNEWTDAMQYSDDAMRTLFPAIDHQPFEQKERSLVVMLKLCGHDHSLVNCYGMFVHVCKMIVDKFVSSFMTNDTNTIIDSTKGAGQCLRFQSH
jgi:hypothetical protein